MEQPKETIFLGPKGMGRSWMIVEGKAIIILEISIILFLGLSYVAGKKLTDGEAGIHRTKKRTQS